MKCLAGRGQLLLHVFALAIAVIRQAARLQIASVIASKQTWVAKNVGQHKSNLH